MLNRIFLSSAILLLMSSCGVIDTYNKSGNMMPSCKKSMYCSSDTSFFDFDSSTLSKETKGKLNFQVDHLNKNKNDKILVVGNADERGPREYNIALGERRANAVKSYLTSKGIDSGRVRVDSMGKEALRCDTTNPIYHVTFGDKDMYHRQNRRAVVFYDDGTVDHNLIIEQERKRCESPQGGSFFNNVLSNDISKDESAEDSVFVSDDEGISFDCD